jgi:predicted negative regulator of RcsB-dependent stress response
MFPFMESTVLMAKMFEALTWLKANLKSVILGSIIGLVVIGGLAMFLYNRSQREVNAGVAFSDVPAAANALAAVQPGQIDGYLKVAQDFEGSKAAARAILAAASLHFAQSNYVEAEKLFQRELKEYPDSPWRIVTVMGLGSCYEQLGKTNEALAKFEEVRKSSAPEADDAKLKVATIFEAQGKEVEALKMYDELLKSYPSAGLGMEAGIKLEDLTNRIPALATNLAPVIPPTPPSTAGIPYRPTNRVITITNFPEGSNRVYMSNMPAVPAPTTPSAPPAAAPTAPAPVPASTNAAK